MGSFDVRQGGCQLRTWWSRSSREDADRWTWLQLMCCTPWIIWSWISWHWRDDKPILASIGFSSTFQLQPQLNIKPSTSSHVIHSPHHQFSSNMSYSQPMQSSSSTIALQPLRSRWSLDADDYRIHSENYHKLYPPPRAKLSHLKSIIRWPQKSSPPTSLPYHIGDPIFFEDSYPLCLCRLCWLQQL